MHFPYFSNSSMNIYYFSNKKNKMQAKLKIINFVDDLWHIFGNFTLAAHKLLFIFFFVRLKQGKQTEKSKGRITVQITS
jgi:hypothetical protein